MGQYPEPRQSVSYPKKQEQLYSRLTDAAAQGQGEKKDGNLM